MRFFLLTILMLSYSFFSFGQNRSTQTTTDSIQVIHPRLPDGEYQATVFYSSYTGNTARFDLTVDVSSDRVVAIRFGDGNCFDQGGSSGKYSYSGGYLSFIEDSDGDVVGASTKVVLQYSEGKLVFAIEI